MIPGAKYKTACWSGTILDIGIVLMREMKELIHKV